MPNKSVSSARNFLLAPLFLLGACAESHEELYNLYSIESPNQRMPSVALSMRSADVMFNLDRYGMVNNYQRMRFGHIIRQVSGNHPSAAHITIYGSEQTAPSQLVLVAMYHGIPEGNIEYVRERHSVGKPVPFSYLVTVERYYARVPSCDGRAPPTDTSFSRRANPDFVERAHCRSIRNLAQSVSDPADFKGNDTIIRVDPVVPQRAPERNVEAAPVDDMASEPSDYDAGSTGAGDVQAQPVN